MSTSTYRQVRNWGQHNKGRNTLAGITARVDTPASENQKQLIVKLLEQIKPSFPDVHTTAFNWIAANRNMSMAQASDVITRLKGYVGVGNNAGTFIAPVAAEPSVPEGYYAVTADEGHTSFYRVSRWKDSKNLKVQLQTSDTMTLISNKAKHAVIKKIIAAGPKQAAERYARELGNCYCCGRTLTNEESRASGIGPTCAKNSSW